MNDQEQSLVDEFNLTAAELTVWGKKVDSILMEDILPSMIAANQIQIPPKFRLKNINAYLDKALYRKNDLANPISDIWDKVGTRVVVLKSSDVFAVEKRILEYPNWKAVVTKTINSQIEEQPKLFDYQSCHIVVSPLENNDKQSLENLAITCEIQVRTLLQHAFAQVSHDSVYKGPYRNDSLLLRHLSKSMALMEATDDYFLTVFNLMSDKSREDSIFLKELTGLYNSLAPVKSLSAVDLDLNDRILSLKGEIPVSLQDVESFTVKYQTALYKALSKKRSLLFEQPVILLIAYYLFNKKELLKQHWPLNDEALKHVFGAFNFSYDRY